MFPQGNGLLFLYLELFKKVNFEGGSGGRAKRKLHKNWKIDFEGFWGWFDGVFEGFDREKRGYEFGGMCNNVQLEGFRENGARFWGKLDENWKFFSGVKFWPEWRG